MTQQEANQMFNEEISTFQKETEFDSELFDSEYLNLFAAAVRYFAPVKLKLTTEDYLSVLEFKATMFNAGIILQVLENASAFQLDMPLSNYTEFVEKLYPLTKSYREILDKEVVRINRKIQAINGVQNGKEKQIPIGKA